MPGDHGLEDLHALPLPQLYRVRQRFEAPRVDDPGKQVKRELERIRVGDRIQPGQNVAVAVGSRGITGIDRVARAVVEVLRGHRARPFITPAMGSHGGATPGGQKEVLASYGITEESMGCPVRATTDVVRLGEVGGIPVFFDRLVHDIGACIPINRIKPHTDFRGEIESGIMKMLAIGLGNPRGARSIHSLGVQGLKRIPAIAEHILTRETMACGIGILENAREETALIRALRPQTLRQEEAGLLKRARELFPRFPVDRFDLLIVDAMGKDISGAGMDTNVLGRLYIRGEEEFKTPDIARVVALDLTEASHGNAIGTGLADFITERLYDKIEIPDTRINVVTSTFVQRGKIPMPLPSDSLCIRTALASLWGVPPGEARIVRIQNTLELGEMFVSRTLHAEIEGMETIETLEGPLPFRFDAGGQLRQPF